MCGLKLPQVHLRLDPAELHSSCVRYLWVGRRSVLHVELQSLHGVVLLDEVRGVQSDVLVEDLKVLTETQQRQ